MKQATIAFLLVFLFVEVQAQLTCASAVPLNLDTTCIDASDPGGDANAGDPTADFVDNNVCSATFSQGEDYIFEFTPATDGELLLELFGSNNFMGLMVTEGCPTTGNCVAFAGTSTNTISLRTCFLAANVTYYVHVSRSSNVVDQFCLNATLIEPNPGTCETAIPLQLDETCVSFDSAGLNSGDPSGCDMSPGNVCINSGFTVGDDYIYSFSPTVTGELRLELFANVNLLGVFVTEGCPETGTCIASGTTSSGTELSVRTCALFAGTTYYVHISRNSSGDIGPFCMNATFDEPNPSICALAKPLALDDNCSAYDSPAANSGDPSGCDLTDDNVCNATFSFGDDYIYTFTPSADGELFLDLLTDVNLLGLMVTEGCPQTGTCVVHETTSTASNPSLRTCFVQANVTYYIHISRNNGNDLGQFCLNARFEEPNPSTPGRAEELQMDATCVSYDSLGANSGNTDGCDEIDNNICSANFSSGPDYFYTLTPFQDTELILQIFTDYNLIGLMVTEGDPITGTCVASVTTSTSTSASLVANLQMNSTYYIQVSRFSNSGGNFCLNAITNPMVPTANEWGLACLILTLLSIGLISLRSYAPDLLVS